MEILKRLEQFSMFKKMSLLILSMKNLYYIIINYFAQYIILSSGSQEYSSYQKCMETDPNF